MSSAGPVQNPVMDVIDGVDPETTSNEGKVLPAGDYSGAVGKSSREEIALVKKLDIWIMPIMWCMYFLNFLDRNAIASARFNGLEKDLRLTGTQYNTCVSILFVGYLLGQLPSNMLMSSSNIRQSYYMGGAMVCWALVSGCTCLVKNYTGLMVIRFILGVVEAPFYPGALYQLSIFYTRKEIAARIAVLYSGNILANSFAGLIAAATFNTIDGALGFKGWQWLFLIEGIVTLLIAIISLFILPDTPLTTRWLKIEERKLTHERIERDTVGLSQNKGCIVGLRQAFSDPLLYLFAFMQNLHLSACSFNNFFPTVVGALGYSKTITLALTCPPYLLASIVGFFVGKNSGRVNERTWHVTGGLSVAIIGYLISCTSLHPAARYISCFLFTSGAYCVNSVILGWVSATLGQTYEKKAMALAVVNMMGNASYIYTPYLYRKRDGPRYLNAMAANAAFAVGCIATAWAMRCWLVKKNMTMKRENPAEAVVFAY